MRFWMLLKTHDCIYELIWFYCTGLNLRNRNSWIQPEEVDLREHISTTVTGEVWNYKCFNLLGLKVNINKTKLMVMGREPAVRPQRARYPCGVCRKGRAIDFRSSGRLRRVSSAFGRVTLQKHLSTWTSRSLKPILYYHSYSLLSCTSHTIFSQISEYGE